MAKIIISVLDQGMGVNVKVLNKIIEKEPDQVKQVAGQISKVVSSVLTQMMNQAQKTTDSGLILPGQHEGKIIQPGGMRVDLSKIKKGGN